MYIVCDHTNFLFVHVSVDFSLLYICTCEGGLCNWSVITFYLYIILYGCIMFFLIDSYTGVTVHFDSLTYGVKEGDSAVVVLTTDGEFAVPFNITVHLRDGSAIGTFLYK